MTDSRPDRTAATAPRGKVLWTQRAILGAVCAVVIGVYAGTAHSGFWESLSLNPAESYYNLLVQGFRAGQLSLNKDAPPGLTQLADPYDPVANARYRGAFYQLHDLSYYRGKLYVYFGVTPALLLFWPYVALTGHYLFHRASRRDLLCRRLSGQRRGIERVVAALLFGGERVGDGLPVPWHWVWQPACPSCCRDARFTRCRSVAAIC